MSSWADQWDHNPEPVPMPPAKHNSKLGGGSMVGKYGKKTKNVAVIGAKKVKQGTSIGFQWIKDKYQKTTQKH
ncbi:hypothetical protein CTI12_AA292640 [Artemisia annua]|uniref:Uncharacterized protein n=1 Tax=Artemisia annua TaxID=35608 RepID=A0A2U1N9A2_ARTAN|nr:hypothetical protein CTI12_AA292640 [Artemisia annua]